MATKYNKYLKGTNYTRKYLNLDSDHDIACFTKNLINIGKLESLPDDVLHQLESHSWKIIKSFTKKYSLLSSDSSRAQFRSASKRHQRVLNTILSNIIECLQDDDSDLHIIMRDNTIKINFNSINIISEDITPRSFSKWYNALSLLSQENITRSNKIVICRLLATLYNIVNEPILTESEKASLVSEAIDNLSSKAKYSTADDFLSDTPANHLYHKEINDIKTTIAIIKSCLVDRSITPPLWAVSIVRSLRLLIMDKRKFIFDNVNTPLSSNSSGTSFKTRNGMRTMPGLFASICEPDYVKDIPLINQFDNIVGFNQQYCINNDIKDELSIISKRRSSIDIPQKKPKPRIIHILNNSEQDRLSYYHNLFANVLRGMQEDCTFNQEKGPKHIKDVMANHLDWGIYSLDLTSATDTFNIGLQKLILQELIFCNNNDAYILADAWYYLMTFPSVINKYGISKEFAFTSGQPQGYLSSFPSFALEHHIVVLTLCRIWDEKINPNTFYRILGDDLVITAKDTNMELPYLYTQYIAASNVDCNINKGYIYNKYKPGYENIIAEFAKYLIIKGTDITPIPSKLLMANDLGSRIALLAWYSDHRSSKLAIEELIFFIESFDSNFDYKQSKPVIEILCNLMIPGIIKNSFKMLFKRIENFTIQDFCIVKDILVHTIMYGTMNRLISNKPFEVNNNSLVHLSGELRPLLAYIHNTEYCAPDNKVSIMIDKLYNYSDMLKNILQNYSSYDQLTDEDIEIVCLFLNTNNDKHIKDDISLTFDALEILTESEETIEAMGLISQYTNRLLDLLQKFNISIDRSWSTYAKKVPTEYIYNLNESIKKTLSRFSLTIEEYCDNNLFTCIPACVESHGSDGYSYGNILYELSDEELLDL